MCHYYVLHLTIGVVHLALRPLRVHRSGGEWCCAAAVTHMYTHIYIHVNGAWCVYDALPYSSRMD